MAGGIRGGGSGSSEDEPMAEMNLIPLIDISLTLLIILMVTSAFIKRPGVNLKLPETATREGKPQTSGDLTVAVGSDGRLAIDGTPIEDAQLGPRLQAWHRSSSREGRVLIRGDRDVTYSRIMMVMDAVRQAGITRVVLPTDPLRPAPAEPEPGAPR